MKENSETSPYFTWGQLLAGIRGWIKSVLAQWKKILLYVLVGALLGFGLSFLIQPKYYAHLSFSLIDKASSSSGLAELASNFGFMSGSSSSSAFTGDNLLEIMKSGAAVERTLLSEVQFKGDKIQLIDAYLDITGRKAKWQKRKPELARMSFRKYPEGGNLRQMDSVLQIAYKELMVDGNLIINRKDKRISLVNVDFVSTNEEFSKLFTENLMQVTYDLYMESRTGQMQRNIRKMEQVVDSVRRLYEASMYGTVSVPQVNINPAMQIETVPRMKQESNARLYGTVYAEVMKNLETMKMEMDRETPIFQTIDVPKYPLKKVGLSKLKGIVLGGFVGGLIGLMLVLAGMYLHGRKEN